MCEIDEKNAISESVAIKTSRLKKHVIKFVALKKVLNYVLRAQRVEIM